MKIITRMLVALCLIAFGACETDTAPNSLKVSSNNLSIAPSGGIASFSIVTDAPLWTIDNPTPDWVLLSTVEGKGRESTVIITIPSKSLTERSCLLTIKAGTAPAATVTLTQGASDYLYQINANTSNITAPIQPSTTSILINTDAPTWNLHSDVDWIELSSTSGGQGSTLITATTPLNNAYKRFATLTLSAENALSVKISVFQDGKYFPNYNTSSIAPDEIGMSSTAAELAAKIKVGWNIGNTLEAIGGETAWGNPLVTEDLIKTVKQNGFNAIRIPCAWNQYMEKSEFAQLKTSWLNRVKQVVQYCVDNDMYALLNIHWDGGWLENNCTPEKQEENNDKQRLFGNRLPPT
jgi:endoglucanase